MQLLADLYILFVFVGSFNLLYHKITANALLLNLQSLTFICVSVCFLICIIIIRMSLYIYVMSPDTRAVILIVHPVHALLLPLVSVPLLNGLSLDIDGATLMRGGARSSSHGGGLGHTLQKNISIHTNNNVH